MMPATKINRTFRRGLELFFLGWCAVAGWLLWGSDDSASVRFAFALCGTLAVSAGCKDGVLILLLKWLAQKKAWLWLTLCVLLFLVGGMCFAAFNQAQGMAWTSSADSNLKEHGFALLRYADEHNGILPPDMRRQPLYKLIAPWKVEEEKRFQKRSGVSFVWCSELSGLRLSDIDNPEKVVVAYTAEPVSSFGYSILFLDGHIKHARGRSQLIEFLRPRAALIQGAKETKARRIKAIK